MPLHSFTKYSLSTRFVLSTVLCTILAPNTCPHKTHSNEGQQYSEHSEVAQSCPTLFDPMDCSLPVSSIHGIFQARVLEWVAISFSRGSFWPKDRTQVSRFAGRCFTIWGTREAQVRKLRTKKGPVLWLSWIWSTLAFLGLFVYDKILNYYFILHGYKTKMLIICIKLFSLT